MKWWIIALVLITSVMLFGCSKMAIENTINDWEDAINNSDPDALKHTISPDSDYYVTETFNDIIDVYFKDFTPVSYSNLDININNPYADVMSDASYKGLPIEAKFVMKKNETFFSFILPEWKIYRYYDNNNTSGQLGEPVWKQLKQ